MFLAQQNKMKLVLASFSFFLSSFITIIISMYCSKTDSTVLFPLLLRKIVQKASYENLELTKNIFQNKAENSESLKNNYNSSKALQLMFLQLASIS